MLLLECLAGRRTPQQIVIPTTLINYESTPGNGARRKNRG